MNFFKKELKINIAGLFFVGFFAIIINQYYGNQGLFPHDSLSHFETGARITKGFHPFKDFWIVSGPFVDYSQALIFKTFGINWNSYVFHASLINALLSCLTFYIFRNYELNFTKSIFFAVCFAVLAYPSSGTPFVDHHSTFFSLMGLYCVILSIKNDSRLLSFFIPIIFIFAFFSKQVPATYIALFSIILFVLYIFVNNKMNQMTCFFGGLFFTICLLVFIGLISGITINSFTEQYLLYPPSIASNRFQQFNVSIIGLLSNFKFILISLILFLYFSIKNTNFNKTLRNKKFYFISLFLLLTLSLIFHQVLTKNQIFIFFLIPILLGLSEINVKNKYFSYFIILLCLFTTVKYHERFNEKRKFHELVNVDLSKASDAELIDRKLKNLKWITPQYRKNSIEEIDNINRIKKILKNDSRKKMVLSNYPFLSVILNEEFFSTTRWHTFDGTDYPEVGNKYFKSYKKLFLKKIKDNKISVIYTIYPVGKDQIYDVLDPSCFDKNKISKLVITFDIKTCEELN